MSCPNNIEIERKFLVRDDSYKALATSSVHIRQGYLCRSASCTVRVRVVEKEFYTRRGACTDEERNPEEVVTPMRRGGAQVARQLNEVAIDPCELVAPTSAVLTIKSAPAANGFAHYEFEKPISVDEANELLKLALPGMIDKRRWLIPIHSLPFREESEVGSQLVCEVDEFFGDNAGLVMAEVELPSEDTPFVHPDFLGDEVTFDKRYYNSYLSQHPFTTW